MPLLERLAARIAASGPLTIDQYMSACLHDPQDGYYATRPALGADGDFLTAPLVSQMFGELLGVWVASAWRLAGAPARIRLVEMGPGDGTLMEDLLRAAGHAPGFLDAADIWLVETSPPLAEQQRARLGRGVSWTTSLEAVPAGAPLLLVANELLDCLPARQFVRTVTGWCEQQVGVTPRNKLTFRLEPAPADLTLPDARVGEVFEHSSAQEALGRTLGQRLTRDGGAALLIDYGRAQPSFGDTLQALRRHRKVHPLACPGEADLTVHADFPAVMAAAEQAGAVAAIQTQSAFLARLSIGERAEALVRARPDQAGRIGRQLNRLIAGDQMGELFKVCCLRHPDWIAPAFEDIAP